ncbi:MAG: hypothetical protein OWS03_00015, partial [Alicyclobacillaceae bacterium]|nr:hypothetical protein [Alicyclobacillaceae bacterium]
AKAAHVERTKVHRMLQGVSKGNVELWSKLLKCAQDLEQNRKRESETVELLRERCRIDGVRAVAQQFNMDPRHLSAVLKGKRRLKQNIEVEL